MSQNFYSLKIKDTQGLEKRTFESISGSKKVNVYVCGITPYSASHIGHARSYINFDFIIRVLRFSGYQVNYIRNFTDIDDKLLIQAKKESGDQLLYKKIADKFINDFNSQMSLLNCTPATISPRATEYIEEILKLIQVLVDKDAAYKLENDIYFDIAKSHDYGKLSGRKIDEQIAGKRVDLAKEKRNDGDFVLWKGSQNNEFWDSQFGNGRPGWHIECSAMINKNCSQTLDIHGGGADLIFPHHENEIAQSETANGYPLANFWLHNALLNIDKGKMSKSLGNDLSIDNILKKFLPEELRFYTLQHHYRQPIEFSFESLQESCKAYKKLATTFALPKNNNLDLDSFEKIEKEASALPGDLQPVFKSIFQAVTDDFNSPMALGEIFKNINSLKQNEKAKILIEKILTNIFGLKLCVEEKQIPQEILDLIAQRNQARKDKNWEKADQLRDEIIQAGFEVKDEKL